mgnify:CR=1 FL=1
MTFNNLYTSGEEFVLPNGENYVGAYHVHVSKGAMVGGTHTTTPHDRLTPVNSRVAERIKSLQAQLKGQMDSTIKKRRASRPSGPSSPASSSQTPPPSSPPPSSPPAPSAPSSGSSGGGGGYSGGGGGGY